MVSLVVARAHPASCALREDFNVPIDFDEERGGWWLNPNQPTIGPQYEMHGLWFSAEEAHALLTMQHLLIAPRPH